jgi:hypothetical protein
MLSRRGLTALLRPTSSAIRVPITKLLSRRTFAYPKEGVFQAESPPAASPRPHVQAQYGAPLPPPPPPRSASSRWYVPHWTTVLIAIGAFYYGLTTVLESLDDFPLRVPTQFEDDEQLAQMWDDFEKLPVVQNLRKSWHLVNGQRESLWTEWTAYQALNGPARRAERLTTGPLKGSHGIAAQKIFLNKRDGSMVQFVCFGNGTVGWPGIVHGGVISTVIDEAFGRYAARHLESRTGVTASLEVAYQQKSSPGQWYIIMMGEDDENGTKQSPTKMYMAGVMVSAEPWQQGAVNEYDGSSKGTGFATNGELRPHIRARALYVVPKTVQLAPIPDEF